MKFFIITFGDESAPTSDKVEQPNYNSNEQFWGVKKIRKFARK